MSSGEEGLLTLTIGMRVSPESSSEQELISLMKRYRDVLNYSTRVVIENRVLSLAKPINFYTEFLRRDSLFKIV